MLYRPTIVGTDNVPKTGGVILASNHLSFIDPFAILLAAPRQVHYLAKDDYFTAPAFAVSSPARSSRVWARSRSTGTSRARRSRSRLR